MKSLKVAPIILTLAAGVALCAPSYTHAQATEQRGATPQRTSAQPKLFDPKDTVILLLDHQTGLFQTVKDITIQELRTNTAVLAKLATLAKIPVITTASEPSGPNGPLMPEIQQFAPTATYVARKGEISAWENPDFVRTVRATGKKTLIIGGVWTSVCVAFPAIQAKAEGYTVYAVIDASGRHEPDGFAGRARPHDASRRYPGHHERGRYRSAAYLGAAGCRAIRRAVR
jgi:nicotinamidase-related amidase